MFKAFKTASDKVGPIVTLGGLLLFPFFGMAANIIAAKAAAAGAVATNGAVMTSFWSGLVTDPVTGQMGLGEGLKNIFNGWRHLGGATLDVAGAGLSAAASGQPVGAALSGAWKMGIG